ncbi:IPT/TIG domain-containing protein [Streptantibioticus ferralitis]|uniref:IPT/TIG domain-containing protein n=1 Tax=Streptantibioticus ferralitis TaxID=236510 RepID=A0ABT5ZCM3_9ACTN|nr:IPT/TIG domain-containing protein [Streptantibioticus ferralitis]MDF2261592.1 IPT/TIG domain-containing protein [Streptantibioticus ferralitis]
MSAPATNVVVTSPTTLTCTTPPGADGPANVTVQTPGGTGTLPNGYTYAPVPTLGSVSPNTGPVTGGQTVTLTGTGFVVGSTTVTFGLLAGQSVTVTLKFPPVLGQRVSTLRG